MKNIIITLLALFNLTACATQGINSISYVAPIPITINNEVVVQKTYSDVWDILVKEISKSFYVINNIDKESRIINVSFNTNSPADFIDCGKTHRTYTQEEKIEVFDYDVAGASQYKIAGDRQPHPAWVSYAIIRRDPNLEGRANIYIAPSENNKNSTLVTINSRYIWNGKIKGEWFNENIRGYKIPMGYIPESSSNITFNTKSHGELIDGNTKIVCVSKGKLESEILKLVSITK